VPIAAAKTPTDASHIGKDRGPLRKSHMPYHYCPVKSGDLVEKACVLAFLGASFLVSI